MALPRADGPAIWARPFSVERVAGNRTFVRRHLVVNRKVRNSGSWRRGGKIDAGKIVDSYKNLKEVETFFDDLKHFVDIRPIRHWLEKRVRAHVFLCILALLLKRLFEINSLHGKSVTEPLAEIEKVKLVKYKVKFSEREDRYQIIPKVTTISPTQKQYFNKIGLKNPSNLELFLW